MTHRAKDLMQASVVTVRKEASLLEAHRLLVAEQIHGAPIVDEAGTVLGMLSALDVLRAVQEEPETGESGREERFYRDFPHSSSPEDRMSVEDSLDRMAGMSALEVMTPSIVSVPPDADVADVARTLRAHQIHRVLVLDGSKLVGILTSFDLLGLLERQTTN